MKEIDIHYGKPTVDTALGNLQSQIKLFKNQKCKALRVITGYGSTTGNHRIKTATIEYLTQLKEKKQIKDFIKGEEIDIFNSVYQNFKFKDLLDTETKNKANKGFVVIIL